MYFVYTSITHHATSQKINPLRTALNLGVLKCFRQFYSSDPFPFNFLTTPRPSCVKNHTRNPFLVSPFFFVASSFLIKSIHYPHPPHFINSGEIKHDTRAEAKEKAGKDGKRGDYEIYRRDSRGKDNLFPLCTRGKRHPGEEANNLVCCWISRALMVKNSVLIEPAIGKDLSSNLTLLGLNFYSDEKKIFLY